MAKLHALFQQNLTSGSVYRLASYGIHAQLHYFHLALQFIITLHHMLTGLRQQRLRARQLATIHTVHGQRHAARGIIQLSAPLPVPGSSGSILPHTLTTGSANAQMIERAGIAHLQGALELIHRTHEIAASPQTFIIMQAHHERSIRIPQIGGFLEIAQRNLIILPHPGSQGIMPGQVKAAL